MASEPPAPAADPTGPTSPNPEHDRDFSDLQLKPAPLRLSRKSQSSTENSHADDQALVTSSSPRQKDQTAHTPRKPQDLREPLRINHLPILELTPPAPRQPAPALATIVSKYEVLDAISHIDTRAFSGPASPRRHPRTPTSAGLSPLSPQQQSIFREGSPFRKLPRLAVPSSERSSLSHDQHEDISPTTITSAAGLKDRLRSVAAKERSPLKQQKESNTNEKPGDREERANEEIQVFVQKLGHDTLHGRFAESRDTAPLKRPSRPKTDEITGWDPKIVAERRKIFERGKFTEPRVTLTTVPSSSVRRDAARELPDLAIRTSAKKHSHPVDSRLSEFLSPEVRTPQRKWNSVADLRLSFERSSESGTGLQLANASAKPPLGVVKTTVQSTLPTTPSRSTIITAPPAIEGRLGGHTAPTKHAKISSKEEEYGINKLPADSLHRTPLRHSIPMGYHSAGVVGGLKQSTSTGSFQKGSHHPFVGRQTKSDKQEADAQKASPYESSPLRSNFAYPLLRPRILSVKISTTNTNSSPGKSSTANLESEHTSSGSGSQDKPQIGKVQALRAVFYRPPEPAMFLPFFKKNRRDTAPAKSGPSLPITVSTTVAVSTQRTSSQSRSSSGGSVVVSSLTSNVGVVNVPSLPDPRDTVTYTPSRPPRNKLRKRRESPVKDRISLFENMAQDPGSAVQKPARSKSYDSGAASGMDRKRVPGWEFKRGSKMFRVLSFGSNKGTNSSKLTKSKAASKIVTAKSSLEAMKRNSIAVPSTSRRTSKLSFLQSAAARRESAIIVRGSVYKVPNQEWSPEQHPPAKAIGPSTAVWSSVDLVNNTTETPPTLFHAASTRSGRILPTRKSYGALVLKPDWEARGDTTFTNPFESDAGTGQDGEFSATESNLPSTITESVISRGEPGTSPMRRSRYPSSFGRKAGQTLKRIAVGPILSPDEGRAVPSRRSSLSHSWGRRAAAAAFAIGRRLRERRTSGSRSQSVQGGEGGSSSATRPVSRDEGWDVFVATPSAGLQHPRPARVLDLTNFEAFGGERGRRTQAQEPSGKL